MLIWEDTTGLGATKLTGPTASALQQEKPPQWETCTLQWRVAPAATGEKSRQQQRPSTAKNKKINFFKNQYEKQFRFIHFLRKNVLKIILKVCPMCGNVHGSV